MARRVIALLGQPVYSEDYAASEAITPGHLIEYVSAGTCRKHATAGGAALPMFAMERDEMGKDIDDAYAVSDTVKAGVFHTGQHVYAIIASGQNIARAQDLESAGNGTLRAIAAGARIAKALEAVNNSAGPGDARIRVEINQSSVV